MSLVYMATEGEGRVIPLAEISRSQNIQLNYIEQIFNKLRHANIVNSQRGPGGGYTLAKPAESINLYEILQVFDEQVEITRCSLPKNTNDIQELSSANQGITAEPSNALPTLSTGCVHGKICNTHNLWYVLGDRINNLFRSITLSDVARGNI